MPPSAAPLKHLLPGWYAIVMGLCGLSLAWHRAQPLMGDSAAAVSLVIGVFAAAVLVVLLGASAVRATKHPQAWAEDRRHPVRHTFIAALPVSLILMATVGLAHGLPVPPVRALWWVGCVAQLTVTLWVMARWWSAVKAGGLQWVGVAPPLFIPIVGNVLTPLAGVPLGHGEWAAAQFGIGLLFWPVVTALLLARIAIQGPWPDRLLPTTFIFIAPPAVVGLAAMQMDAPAPIVWMLYGMALFTTLWVGTLARRIGALPFGMSHWGMSFPLAAIAAFTLRLATPGSAMAALGIALLALASLVIAGLMLGTVRGLREGTLLVPEPVAAIQPASSGPAGP